MPKAKAGAPARKKKVNGYVFPDPLPPGEILKDVGKKEWCLGRSIGKGGFGEIYSACEAGAENNKLKYAIKIEPHENGPLFVERSFYIKVCKPDKLDEWKKKRGAKILGVPSLQGFGSHMYKDKNYRFVVMDRFGKDLWSVFLEKKKTLPPQSVFNYAVQVLDALEYIHSTGYVHSDVKGANLLFGFVKGTENNLFLVDFGLASKYSSEKEFKRDPKKAHNGTIEYTSRDLHQGVPTRRSDLEILGFNLLHWLNSTLPWENLTDPEKAFQRKTALMSDIKETLSTFAPNIPPVITDYLMYVSKLGHLEEPNYDQCRNMFEKALSKLPKDRKTTTPRARSKTPKKRVRATVDPEGTPNGHNDEDNEEYEKVTSPTKRNRSSKPKASWKDAPCIEPGKIATAASSKRNKKNESKPTEPEAQPSSSDPPVKLSWRDFPTIKSSNIQIAGQYNKKTSVKPKKK